jgi:hypothetical protein
MTPFHDCLADLFGWLREAQARGTLPRALAQKRMRGELRRLAHRRRREWR